MNRKHWWIGITALAVLGAVGFGYIGIETYRTAPPLPSFTDSAGSVVISRATILRGQVLFQRYALMNYGSVFGDGAGRGPVNEPPAAIEAHAPWPAPRTEYETL